MKRSLLFGIMLLIAFVLISIIFFSIVLLKGNLQMGVLKNEDFNKYNQDIIVEYGFDVCKYILNLNNDITICETNNNDIMNEYTGYHYDKYNGENAILDQNNNLIILEERIIKELNIDHLYGIIQIKHISENDSICFLLTFYGYEMIVIYNLKTSELFKVMKISRLNNRYIYYQLTNDKIYALNEEKELCEYDIISKNIRKLGVKPIAFNVKNDLLVYYVNNAKKNNSIFDLFNRNDVLCVYDLIENKVINRIKTKGTVEWIEIDDDNNFILTTELMFGFTSINEGTIGMNFTPKQKNRAVLYEISSGKYKIIKEADRNNLVYSAKFAKKNNN